NMKSLEWLHIPRVYWDYTSTTLNVQEYIDGISAKNLAAIDAAGLDRKLIARRGCHLVWKSILEDGFFHADPHPGNILILPNNRICLIDFGMVGTVTTVRRAQLVRLIKGVVMQDGATAVSVLVERAEGAEINAPQLGADAEALISQYYGVKLAQIDITQLLSDVVALMQRHDLTL